MVRALSSNPQQALHTALQSAGIDPAQGKKELSAQQIQALSQHLAELPPVQKKWATEGLQKALAQDAFELQAQNKATFATLLGIPVERMAQKGDLRRQQPGSKNVLETTLQHKGKAGKLSGAQMEQLVASAQNLPPEMQALVFNSLAENSKSGRIEMDSKARKPFMRQMLQVAKDTALPSFLQEVENRISPRNDQFAQLMASGMCFEDLVAAFMMLVASSIQDDVKEKMREIEAADRRERMGGGLLNKATDALANKLGVTQSNIDVIEDVPGTSSGPQPGLTPDQVAKTRVALEAVVQSTDHHLQDDGVIDAVEGKKIVEKLNRLDGPVGDLVAASLLNAMRRSGLVAAEGSQPMVEWCKSRLGDDVDTSPLPAGKPGSPESDVAKSLSESPKLEDRIAGFMVDALLSSEKDIKEKMAAFKPIRDDMLQYPASAKAFDGATQVAAATTAAVAQESAPEKKEEKPGLMARVGEAVKDVVEDATTPTKSRQMMATELQTLMQEFSQVMQAMSNVLNAMHQTTMNSVRNIR
tara:strand:+ start:6232 stop:7815 length:1584 start_codon:yes stop_codon:yes gene_type:complete